jgi:predicted lipid-binding transport protein (Tim44 family)
MGSMGDQIIDIILFAVVALFFAVQLWRVLGTRTGAERPPVIPPQFGRMPNLQNNVIPMPQRPAAAGPVVDNLESGLDRIRQADPRFRVEDFVGGAQHAFGLIVNGFAAGDLATLRPLVGDEVFDAFSESVRQRLRLRETVETRILRLDAPEIVEARLEDRTAILVVRFVSSQLSVTRGPDGSPVEGDPDHPIERTDLWTFARNAGSADPNWTLIGTGSPE